MFASRLITLLIGFACATLAYFVSHDVLTIQLVFLKWLVASSASFFAISAFVMWIGLTDSKKASDGALEFGVSRRGRIMRYIVERLTLGTEPHCCDVYVGTSVGTLFVLACIFTLWCALFFLVTATLEFFIIALGVLSAFGLICLLVIMDEKGYLNWPKREHPASERAQRIMDFLGKGISAIVVISFVFICSILLIYQPIVALMEMGYTLVMATLLYTGWLMLLPIPAYCLGGKKLLLKTNWGKKVCPVVHMTVR